MNEICCDAENYFLQNNSLNFKWLALKVVLPSASLLLLMLKTLENAKECYFSRKKPTQNFLWPSKWPILVVSVKVEIQIFYISSQRKFYNIGLVKGCGIGHLIAS